MVAQWFYQTAEGQQSGPIDSKELRRLADAGIVRPDTLVRQGDTDRWVRAEQVRGLFQRTTPAPSPSSLVKATLVQPPAPPPLPSAQRESGAPIRSVGGESPVRDGRGAAAVPPGPSPVIRRADRERPSPTVPPPPPGAYAAAQSREASPRVDAPRPNGVGGWLLFFCVSLTIVSPLYNLGQISMNWEQSQPAFAQFPSLKTAVMWENAGSVALVIYGFVVGCMIWGGNPKGPEIAKKFLLIRLFGFIGIEFIAVVLMGDMPSEVVASVVSAAVSAVFANSIWFLIWWFYFKKSKRVRNTYARPRIDEFGEARRTPPPPESGALVNEASEKRDRIHPSTWADVIAGTGLFLLLLLLLALAFRGGGSQQQAENDQPPSVATQSAESSESVPIPDAVEILERFKNDKQNLEAKRAQEFPEQTAQLREQRTTSIDDDSLLAEIKRLSDGRTQSQYAQNVRELKEIGMEDGPKLRALAGFTALAFRAIEGIVPNPVVGKVQLTEGAMKAARKYVWEALKKAPGEMSEEYLQGVSNGLGEHVALYLDENAEDKSIGDAFRKGWEQTKESKLRMAFLRGVHAATGAQLPATQSPATQPQSLPPTGKILELADLAELVGPSVVQVNVTKPENAGTGSGFVLDKQGTIVTNYHVIEDATSGTIVFSDRRTAPITGYLGVWPEKDIALVHVKCAQDKLHPLRLATAVPRQGERVAAFGSPLGLQQSVSEGIVSAVRESEELRTLGLIDVNARLIQITTPISHGNSGGPLVDMKGLVVGVNTWTFRPLGGENVNFAVAAVELTPLLLAKSENASPLPANNPVDKVRRILSRAKDHYDAGDYRRAIADYTEAIRFDRTNPFSFSSRGNAYLKEFDYENAIADYTDAIRLNPKNPSHYQARGYVYILKQDNDRALADFTEATRLDPKNADWHYWRGFAYMVKGDNDLAIADYTEAIRLNPKHPSAFTGRGTAYRSKGDYDSAIADYTEAIRLDPEDPPFSARGDAYRQKGDYDRAIADYDEAIRLNPPRSGPVYYLIFYGRGECYRKKMDYDRAIGNYTEAIRIDPQNAEAYWERGKAYELKGNKAIAKRDFEQATKLGYKPPDSRSRKRNPAENESKVAETKALPERSEVRDQWKKIVIGMPYPQVEKLLGRPNDVTSFGFGLANWTYRFDWTPYDGRVTFDNGRVTGWSEPLDWKLNK